MSLYTELKDRKVIRVGAVYLVVAWLIVQVVVAVSGPLLLPDWFARGVILLLALGFPFALILSWIFDATPAEASGSSGISGKPLALGLIALTAIAIGFILTGFNSSDSEPTESELVFEEQLEESAPPVEVTAQIQELLPNSIAVLPFENLSLDPEDAFFAVGIHEEVLNQLVKLSALNVIARTTMSRYANGEKSIAQVGEELNVETVMEGSVRYADDRVLVTVQLIDPVTELHLWSESYNREFADIFAIQADIAMNIANALHAEFSEEEQARIEEIPTTSPVAYALYLKTFTAQSIASAGAIARTLADLDRAIELDPEFALAYERRATMFLQLNRRLPPEDWEVNYALAQESVERALEINPLLASAYGQMGDIYAVRWQVPEALEAYERMFELGSKEVESSIGWTLKVLLGGSDRFDRMIERYAVASSYHVVGFSYLMAGDFDKAEESFQENLKRSPLAVASYLELSRIESRRKNFGKAIEYLEVREGLISDPTEQQRAVSAYAYGLAGSTAGAVRQLNAMQEASSEAYVRPLSWALAYLGSGDYEQALAYLWEVADNKEENPPTVEMAVLNINMFNDPVLEQPEFVEVRQKLGVEGLAL